MIVSDNHKEQLDRIEKKLDDVNDNVGCVGCIAMLAVLLVIPLFLFWYIYGERIKQLLGVE